MYGKVFVILLLLALEPQTQGSEEIKVEKKWDHEEFSSQNEDDSYGTFKRASVSLNVCKISSSVILKHIDTELCQNLPVPKIWSNIIKGPRLKLFKDVQASKIFWKCREIFPFKVLSDNSFVKCSTTTNTLILKTTSQLCKKYYYRSCLQILKLFSSKKIPLTLCLVSYKKFFILFLFCDSRDTDDVANFYCLWKLCSKKNNKKKRNIRDITKAKKQFTKSEAKKVVKNSVLTPVTKDKLLLDLPVNVTDINKNISTNLIKNRNSTLKPVTANKVKNNINNDTNTLVTQNSKNGTHSVKRMNSTEDFVADKNGTLFRKLRKIKSMADLKVVADEFKLNDTMILELKRELLLKYSKHPQWAFGCVVFIILLTLCAVHYSRIYKNCNKDVVIIDHKEVHYVYVNDLVKKRTKVLPHLKLLLGKIRKDKNQYINRRNYNIDNLRHESENIEKQDSKSDWLPRKRGKSKRNVFSALGKVFSSSNKKQRKIDNRDTLPLLEEDSEEELYDIDEYSKYQNNSQDVGSSHDQQEDITNARNVVTKRTVTSLAEDYGHSQTAAVTSQNSQKNRNNLSVIKEI